MRSTPWLEDFRIILPYILHDWSNGCIPREKMPPAPKQWRIPIRQRYVLTDFARVDAEKTAVECLTQDEGWFTLSRWRLDAWRFSADGVITLTILLMPFDSFTRISFRWCQPGWSRKKLRFQPQLKRMRWSTR